MTTLIIGLDGLDAEYISRTGLLSTLDTHELTNDFEGANALYTYRIWPSIMAGEAGDAASDDPYTPYQPDGAYLWEKYPASVLLAPTQNPSVSLHTDAFPTEYIESFSPGDRLDTTLNKLDDGVRTAIREGDELVVACTRTPDIVGHHVPDEADYWISRTCGMVERWIRHADDYLVVSDHGFDYENWGMQGIEAHTDRALFASSFCDYHTMTDFCNQWHYDLQHEVVMNHMEALGYR